MPKTMMQPTTFENLRDLHAAQEALTFKLARSEDLTEEDHMLVSHLGWDLREWSRDESRKEIGRANAVLANIPLAATAAEREAAKLEAKKAADALNKNRSDIEARIAAERGKLATLEFAASETAAVVAAQEQAVAVLRAKVPPVIRQRYDRTQTEISRRCRDGSCTAAERDFTLAENEKLLDHYLR